MDSSHAQRVADFVSSLPTIPSSALQLQDNGTGHTACPFCISDFTDDHEAVRTACGHCMCRDGLQKWLNSGFGRTCPVCRHGMLMSAEANDMLMSTEANDIDERDLGLTAVDIRFLVDTLGRSPPHIAHPDPMTDEWIASVREWAQTVNPATLSARLQRVELDFRRIRHWVTDSRWTNSDDWDTVAAQNEYRHLRELRDCLRSVVPADRLTQRDLEWRYFDQGWFERNGLADMRRRFEMLDRVFGESWRPRHR